MNQTRKLSIMFTDLRYFFLELLNPSQNKLVGDLERLPILEGISRDSELIEKIIHISKKDWNSFEISSVKSCR